VFLKGEVAMNFLEFFTCAHIDDKEQLRRIVDVRPFGKKQDEALYFYLHEIIEARMSSGSFVTDRRIVIRWDAGANVTDGTVNLLHNLRSRGAPIDPDTGEKSAPA
jgi:hypothetical protein